MLGVERGTLSVLQYCQHCIQGQVVGPAQQSMFERNRHSRFVACMVCKQPLPLIDSGCVSVVLVCVPNS